MTSIKNTKREHGFKKVIEKMNKQIFLKWFKINSLCFIGAFIVIFLIVQLFTWKSSTHREQKKLNTS